MVLQVWWLDSQPQEHMPPLWHQEVLGPHRSPPPEDLEPAQSSAFAEGWWLSDVCAQTALAPVPVLTETPTNDNPSMIIRNLEGSLAVLLATTAYESTRRHIKDQIEEPKRSITRSKPLTSLLVSCNAALERLKARKAKAQVAFDAAQNELSAADY